MLRDPVTFVLVAGAALAASSLPAPPRAHACGSTPCALQVETVPEDGTTGVPTNAELRVLYFGTLRTHTPEGQPCADDSISRMRLRPESGEPLELTAVMEEGGETEAWMVARPEGGLEPATRYALDVRYSQQSDCACDAVREWKEVAQLTTGDGPDTEPPSLDGDVVARVGKRLAMAGQCGSTDGFEADLVGAAAEDGTSAPRFDILVDGEVATRYAADLANEVFVDCRSATLMTSTVVRPGQRLELRAVDLAGNTSDTVPVELDVSCDAPIESGAGTGADGGDRAPERSASSCAVRPGHARDLAARGGLLAFLVTLYARRSRRPRHRGHARAIGIRTT